MPVGLYVADDVPTPVTASVRDVVGSFHAGDLDHRGMVVSLDTWRVSTADANVAMTLLDLYDGTIAFRATMGRETLAVDLAVDTVTVLLEPGGTGLQVRYVQRDPGFAVQYTSDGATITYPDGTCEPDPDAALSLDERLTMGEQGRGPRIEVDAVFRLHDAPQLGRFRFRAIHTRSLICALVADRTEAAYEAVAGEALATLARVRHTVTDGEHAGRSYITSEIRVVGPVR
jgi:hypothetical protein